MNILTKALDTIKFSVPPEVLRVVFKDDISNWRQAPVSIDTMIMNKVIKPRVLVDADLVGGTQVIIPLDGLTPTYMDQYTFLYTIPLERTNGREIVSVLSVGYMPYFGNLGFNGINSSLPMTGSGNDFAQAGQQLMDSHSTMPSVSTASAELVDYNRVLVRDSQRITGMYTLRCMIANADNLSNISPRSYPAFAKLCLLAVKAYIYNNMFIRMDQAYLSGGQELGAFKNYVDGLADSEEQYNTFIRETWQSVAFHNDQASLERFVRSQISIGL